MDGFVAFLCYVFLGAAIILAILTFLFKKKQLQHWVYVTLSAAALMFIAYQFLPTSDAHKQNNVSATQNSKKINDSHSKKISKDKSSELAKTSSKKSASKSSTEKSSKLASKKASSKSIAAKESSISASKKMADSSSKKSVSQPSTNSNLTPIQKISKSLKKTNSAYFSGATIMNDTLVIIFNDDVAYNYLAGSKSNQKNMLTEVGETIQDYRNNDLAKNGIVFTGANVEDDDGEKSPSIMLYYNKDALDTMPEFSLKSPSYYDDEVKHPLNMLDYSTAYYFDAMFLKAVNARGIYEGVRNQRIDQAPEWLNDVTFGDTTVKPTK